MKHSCSSHNSSSCASCPTRPEGIFSSLSSASLDQLNLAKITSTYRRGQTVFYAGNSPAGLYCVQEGVVKLENESEDGKGHILRIARPGDVLGYRSLFGSEPYEASAVVQEDATICLIPKSAIVDLVKREPELSLKLLSMFSHELKQAERRIVSMADKDATERTAEALLFLKENFPDQNWTRKEIAEWAGTTPETVMRVLARFEDDGLIEQMGRVIKLKDREGLLEAARVFEVDPH